MSNARQVSNTRLLIPADFSGRCVSTRAILHSLRPGFYCVEGAVVPTPCPAGSFSGTLGLKDDSGCSVCTLGHWCGDGSSEPTPCVEGKYGDQTGLLAADNCIACDAAQHRTSIAGSSTCMMYAASAANIERPSVRHRLNGLTLPSPH